MQVHENAILNSFNERVEQVVDDADSILNGDSNDEDEIGEGDECKSEDKDIATFLNAKKRQKTSSSGGTLFTPSPTDYNNFQKEVVQFLKDDPGLIQAEIRERDARSDVILIDARERQSDADHRRRMEILQLEANERMNNRMADAQMEMARAQMEQAKVNQAMLALLLEMKKGGKDNEN